MPLSIDPATVELRALSGDAGDPRYTVIYRTEDRREIVFTLGPAPAIAQGESALGVRVRGVSATVAWAYAVDADPTKPASRRVTWKEGRSVFQIASDRFSGDDLLHIAWSLDVGASPSPPHTYVRTKVGACARQGAPAAETVRALLGLVGSHDRDAVLDCFATEQIGAEGTGFSGWAELPSAANFRVDRQWQFGGREEVQAGWSFSSAPGGAWSPSPVNFFVLGAEDGRWRIHYVWTAGVAPLN
jgi:hypothetical protein